MARATTCVQVFLLCLFVFGLALAPFQAASAKKLDVETATHVGGLLGDLGSAFSTISTAGAAVVASVPGTGPNIGAAWTKLEEPIDGARSLGATGGMIALALGLCAAASLVVRLATSRLRRHWASDALGTGGAFGLFVLDAAERLAFGVAAFALARIWFGGEDLHDRFALAFLWSGVRWWLSMLAVDTLLRPRHPHLRLIRLSTAGAYEARSIIAILLLIGILGISLMPVFLSAGLPIPSGQFIAFLMGLVLVAGGLVIAVRLRRNRRRVLAAESAATEPSAARRVASGVWFGVAIFFIVLLWLAWDGGILFLDFGIYHSLVWSIAIAGLAFIVDRVMGLSERAADRSQPGGFFLRWLPVLRRTIRVGAAFAIAVVLAETWLVDQLGLVAPASWDDIRHSIITAAVTLFIGYVVWALVHTWTERRLSTGAGVGPDAEDHGTAPASRLTTLLPLFRILLGIGIVIMTALVALSQLGVDIGPLVAGAGIFGLALSFGSQALVRDIVSGIFFIADDAFRVGEYIDTGKLKGTVEKISLRSLRLRHQNGQIHTVPYGELSSITNFSRDWSTVKFNLRLVRDADLEKVRKTIKQVGVDMLADPELKPEMIQPLKLQGVADIADNALIVRCKFTVRPVKPSWVQREALKRIYRAFAEKGIQFASNAVTVQTTGAALLDAAAGGASAALAGRAGPEAEAT